MKGEKGFFLKKKGGTMRKLLFILTLIAIWSGVLSAENYSLEFDGINDHVDCGNDPSLTEFDQLTIEAWVWLEDSGPDQKIVSKWKDSDNYYIFGIISGTFYSQINANGQVFSFATGTVPSQQWTHLAVTFSKGNGGSNGTSYAYVNGEIVYSNESVADEPISVNNPVFPFRIGAASWDNNAYPVDGSIDEVRIWNVVRTTTEIRNLMETPMNGNEPGLVAYYQMSDGSGTTLTDNSSNSNTGTLYEGEVIGNGPLWTDDSFKPAGDGSSGNPYQVSELKHLSWISHTSDEWNEHFEQTADIDAAATSSWNNGSGFSPIGDWYSFNGSYNGQDFTIDGIFINHASTDYIGFFGRLWGGYISNLGLTNADITGYNISGGLVGYLGYSTIVNCYVTGSVTGHLEVGGLAGLSGQSCLIINSYASCSVTGGMSIGGLLGVNYSTISSCYAAGDVNGFSDVGGLVGFSGDSDPVYIYNSYSISSVYATDSACGLIGWGNYIRAYNCYAAGSVTGEYFSIGLFGGQYNQTENCFWDVEATGCTESDEGTGKTTAEMKDVFTYTNLATVGLDTPWDFVGNPYDDTGNEDYWDMDACTNTGYPYLTWQSVTPPATTPTNVILTILGNDVQLVWDDIGSSVYYIYRSADPYAEYWNNIGSSESNSYTDVDATLETIYFYYVTACD